MSMKGLLSKAEFAKLLMKGEINPEDYLAQSDVQGARVQSPAGADRQVPITEPFKKATRIESGKGLYDKVADFLAGEQNMMGLTRAEKALEVLDQATSPRPNPEWGPDAKISGVPMGPGKLGKVLLKGKGKIDDTLNVISDKFLPVRHPNRQTPVTEPTPRPMGGGVQSQIDIKVPPVQQTKTKLPVQPQLLGMPPKIAKSHQETSKLPSLLQNVSNVGLKTYDKPAKDLTEALSRFPSKEQLIKLYEKGKGGEDFYTEFKPTIARYMGEENVDQFIDFLAATSPANQLRSNIEMAVKAMEQSKSGKGFQGFMKAHSMNLERAAKGEKLSGPKVQAFQKNLKSGKEDLTDEGVTVDRWMVGIYGGDPKGAPSRELYTAIQANVQSLAKELGISPKDLQAGLWAGARGKKESISSIMQDSFGQRDLFQPEVLSPRIANRAQQLGVGSAVKDIHTLTNKNGGTTFNMFKGDLAGTDNYSVAVFPERTVKLKGAPKPKDIAQYIQKNRSVLDNPEYSLGTWYDKVQDEFVLDVVRTVPDRAQAIKLGEQYKQDAIFGLKNLEEIRLGDVPVEHYSQSHNLTEADPTFMGKGSAGAERARFGDKEMLPRTWFYPKDSKQVESQFRHLPSYEGKLQQALLYDHVKDPMNLQQEAVEIAKTKSLPVATIYENLIKQHGYKGWRDEWRMAWFDKTPLTPKKKN